MYAVSAYISDSEKVLEPYFSKFKSRCQESAFKPIPPGNSYYQYTLTSIDLECDSQPWLHIRITEGRF